jgi:phage-related baseplate assembly protein
VSGFTVVDLAGLPAPDVIEELDFETVLAESVADMQSRGDYTALVESDPAYKVLEVASLRELYVRQRVNDGAKAVMLAYAEKSDLDQIGANFSVGRLTIDPGDPTAIPPVDPVMEDDEDYRRRIQLSPEGYTTAGSTGAYIFHILSADADVKDGDAVSPTPGYVTAYVLSRTGDGEAGPDLIAAVETALNAKRVRPMTDNVTVLPASIVEYEIEAELVMYDGPDKEVVRQAAEDACQAYVTAMHRIGYDITLSGVLQALHQPGVQRVKLTGATPAPDGEERLVHVEEGEAAYCTTLTVTAAEDSDV